MTFRSASETRHVREFILVPFCWLGCACVDSCRFHLLSLDVLTETQVFSLQFLYSTLVLHALFFHFIITSNWRSGIANTDKLPAPLKIGVKPCKDESRYAEASLKATKENGVVDGVECIDKIQ